MQDINHLYFGSCFRKKYAGSIKHLTSKKTTIDDRARPSLIAGSLKIYNMVDFSSFWNDYIFLNKRSLF